MAITLIKITCGELSMNAELNETATAKKIAAALPIEADGITWGDEIYFEIPVIMDPDNAQAEIPDGTLAYWPDGHAFCIFFGQTPYSPVNVIGKLSGDPNLFKACATGERLRVEKR